MSNECGNLLSVVGPKNIIMDIEGESDDEFFITKAVPLKNPDDYDEAYESWGVGCVYDDELKSKEYLGDYGCLQFYFSSSDEPPIELLRKASMALPLLEFHLQYMDECGVFAGQVTYSRGRRLKDIRFENEGEEAYIKQFKARHRKRARSRGDATQPQCPCTLQPSKSAEAPKHIAL